MNCAVITATILSLAIPFSGMAQSTAAQTASLTAPMSAQEVRKLVKTASSREQYTQLASYYHQQEAVYRAKAANEKIERDRLAQGSSGLYHKIPHPVDFAESSYESYVSHADSAALRALHYDQLAAYQLEPQLATSSQSKQ